MWNSFMWGKKNQPTDPNFCPLLQQTNIFLGLRYMCSQHHLAHPCYKTDFLFAKSETPSYLRYTILTTQWTFCVNMKDKLRCIFNFLAFLQNTCFVHNSMGNGPVDALKGLLRTQKRILILFWFFAENLTLLSCNITKLIPFGASNSKV